MCEADLKNILQWYPGVDKSMAYQLAPQGREDLKALGERLRARFPDLFEGQNEDNFEVGKVSPGKPIPRHEQTQHI